MELTPTQITAELYRIQAEAAKGVLALYDAECKLADCENDYDRTLQLAFLDSQGTVADRTAISRLKASEARLAADLAKAEYNRIKLKLRQIELSASSLQSILRNIETELRILR